MQTVLEIAEPHSVAQDFEGEIVALNLANGTYYSLRDLGAVIWRDLAAGHPVERLAAIAGESAVGAQPVLDFAAKATTEGLMRPASGAASPSEVPQLMAALAGGGALDLTFEVFVDMQTLILLDPVHEVDETKGWPIQPKDA
ncbi:MAG: hypothetical protein R3D05_08765 [Dongiaceae bacterium]